MAGGIHGWPKHTPPDKLNPTYLGEGIGHWEGDTLVVDVPALTAQLAGRGGARHTEQLHVMERFTRVNED